MILRRSLPAAALILLLAACGASGGPESHPAASSSPARSSAPLAPQVPPTAADQAVCTEFFAQSPGQAGAAAFMDWLQHGPGSVAAGEADGKLITDITTWYADAWQPSGDPANAALDLDVVYADCGEAGVSQQA